MICPKCDAKNLESTGKRVKEDRTDEYYKCPVCGLRFIVRRQPQKIQPI